MDLRYRWQHCRANRVYHYSVRLSYQRPPHCSETIKICSITGPQILTGSGGTSVLYLMSQRSSGFPCSDISPSLLDWLATVHPANTTGSIIIIHPSHCVVLGIVGLDRLHASLVPFSSGGRASARGCSTP